MVSFIRMAILSALPRAAVRSFSRGAHFLNGLHMEKRGVGRVPDGYFEDKVLLVYFSASWCPSCKLFTPKLKRVYEDASRTGLPLEVLWVSRDRSEEQLAKYYEDKLPPFAYFPFGSENITEMLKKYEVKTIPAIRLVNKDGTVANDAVRPQIENAETGDAKKLLEEWRNQLKK